MPAKRYIYTQVNSESCGSNSLNGFFFSLEGGTQIKDSHSGRKSKEKARFLCTEKQKVTTACQCLVGQLRDRSEFKANVHSSTKTYPVFFFFLLEHKQKINSVSTLLNTSTLCHSNPVVITWDTRVTYHAVKPATSTKGLQHSSVFRRLLKAFTLKRYIVALLQHHHRGLRQRPDQEIRTHTLHKHVSAPTVSFNAFSLDDKTNK